MQALFLRRVVSELFDARFEAPGNEFCVVGGLLSASAVLRSVDKKTARGSIIQQRTWRHGATSVEEMVTRRSIMARDCDAIGTLLPLFGLPSRIAL